MEMRTVAQIMIHLDEYPHVQPDDTLRDAMRVLRDWQIDFEGKKSLPRSLLVFDKNGVLLGTVRRRDIMRGLEPEHLASQPLDYRKKLFDVQTDPNLAEMAFDKLLEGLKKKAEKKRVHEIMRPILVTLDHDDHVIKAIYELVSNNLSLVPVVLGNQVVGVVRTVDVFEELARIVESRQHE